jgi:hypothetical protein
MEAAISAYPTTDFLPVLRLRSAKLLARLTGRSPRTVEAWQRGDTQPRATELIALMRADAAIFAEIARLAGRADAGQRALAADALRQALAALEGK